jgi:hypothetical protein
MSKRFDISEIDFLDLWQSKLFLGMEFLTWLWVRSEVDNEFTLLGGDTVTVWFEGSLKLEKDYGETKQSLTFQHPNQPIDHEWTEAFAAVMRRKQVVNAKIHIRSEENEWSLNLPADTLNPKAVKMVAGANFKEEQGEGLLALTGTLLDRATLLVELNDLVESLLGLFLDMRFSPEWESEELPRLRKWVRQWVREGNKAAS